MTRSKPSNPSQEAAGDPLAVVREFIADVEAVGIESVATDWPDLAITYRKAKAAVDRAKEESHGNETEEERNE